MKKKVKRCAIYVITECDGKLDEYKKINLKALKEISSFLFVACKRDISFEAENEIRQYSNFVFKINGDIISENAYMHSLKYLKSSYAFNFDELVVMNDSVFGPIYPLKTYFEKMESSQEDFWSLTKRKNGLPDSYFVVFGSWILNESNLEKNLNWCLKREKPWDSFIELLISKYNYSPAIEMDDLLALSSNPLVEMPYYLLKNKNSPFVDEKMFYEDYQKTFKNTDGSQLRKSLIYIKKKTKYNVDVIWERILRVGNMADIKKQLQLNYTFSSSMVVNPKAQVKNDIKIALILHIYYDDLASYCRSYVENMPKETDFFVTVPDDNKLKIVKKAFEGFQYNIQYRVTGNIGRDVGPFIVGCKDIIEKYDLICKVHDKRVYQVKPMSIGESWSYQCFENLLKNKVYVRNIIEAFKEDSRLGMLMPPAPIHGPYYPTVGFGEWGFNYGKVLEVYNTLGLKVPISSSKEPVAPLGSMFWFRTKALKPLFDHDWSYEELPEEPISEDQTILHAIERVYPFCIQEAGFYSSWVMADSYAKIEMDNLNYMNRELQKKEFELIGSENFENLLSKIKEI